MNTMTKTVQVKPWMCYTPQAEEIEVNQDVGFEEWKELYLNGAWAEPLNPPDFPEWECLVDEDARMKDLPNNWIAAGIMGQPIKGNIIVLPKGTIK